jgi:ATP-dependent 26S proteasome regulatory subunit
VELILPFYTDMVGLIKAEAPKPALNPSLWEDIEADAAGVFDGSKKKSGALLYGPPGNNKTFFVKYLACKYKVPIKIITFSPDHSNFDVMLMFSQITTRCIVLMEDFDNYFHGRKCILGSDNKNIKFTFDMILNGLDGVYNTYEQVFFIMTVNDIEKVDWALKNRPSRFKFLRQFTCPELDTRKKLLPLEWAEQSEGMNLDQVFRLKEFHDEGLTLEQAKNNLGTANKLQALQELAHALYEKRVANGTAGSCTGDWLEAEKQLGLK